MLRIRRRECLAQCKAIAQRMAPKLLHKLANLAIDQCAPPEIQLQATQSLLKILTFHRPPLLSPITPPHGPLPTRPPAKSPQTPPGRPLAPHTLIVNRHPAAAAPTNRHPRTPPNTRALAPVQPAIIPVAITR